jgi:hypothetical protein
MYTLLKDKYKEQQVHLQQIRNRGETSRAEAIHHYLNDPFPKGSFTYTKRIA